VIADSLQPETQLSLRRLGAQVLEVGFEKSTKVKSLKAAIDHLSNGSAYESVLILDADNVLHPDFYSGDCFQSSCWIPSNSGRAFASESKHRGGDFGWLV